MLKKLIGDRRFYRMVLTVAVPMMLQQGMTQFVSLLDNLMIGSLSITLVFSIGIFREKMKWWQWIGVLLGAVAIALLC